MMKFEQLAQPVNDLAACLTKYLKITRTTLERVLDHAQSRGFRVKTSREQALKLLESAINPGKSPTFRSGKAGKWRESFAPEHKSIFKQVAGDLLIRLGYEISNDW